MFSYRLPSLVALLVAVAAAGSMSKVPLHLLALVPLREGDQTDTTRTLPCVDRGEELLPAAYIAADFANENILREFQLEIVPVAIAECSEDSFSLTLANFVQKITSKEYSVVGVVGMVCSSSVLSVSPLASHAGINVLQITSGTTSPESIFQARKRVINDVLYQAAPPSTIFNDVLIDFLDANHVDRLAVIRHVGTFFIEHDTVVTNLHQKVNNLVNINDFAMEIDNEDAAATILNTIATNSTGIRVIYASVTLEEARLLLCLSISMAVNVTYPRNQWIFHGHAFQDLCVPTRDCSRAQMADALEGVILLQHSGRSMQNSSDVLSHTNLTYNEYLDVYRSKLSGQNTSCGKEPEVLYPNALYDSVMAFALAINGSLKGRDLIGYGIRNATVNVSSLLKHELEGLPGFLGASGVVKFNSETHEVDRNHTVDILVVSNHTVMHVDKANLSIEGSYEQRQQVHIAIPIATMVLVLILVIVHTITLLIFIYYWNDPDIKATSPVLSIVIFIACYMLDLSLLLTALRYSYAGFDVEYIAFCTAENWLLYIGIQLIFATLMMRLVRVYRIFFHYSKLGKMWSDYGILLFIMMLVSVGVAILTIWMAADVPTLRRISNFNFADDPPFFSIQYSCQSEYFEVFPIWIILLLIYTGVMMVIVLLLAIRTRKVKIDSFKDTRTVNIFIYTTVVCFMFLIILSLIFDAFRNQVAVFISRTLALSSVAIACVCFLFIPKIYMAQLARRNPRRKSIVTQLSSTFIVGNKNIMTTAF